MDIFDAIAQYKIDYPKVKIRDKTQKLSISLDDEASCFEQLANLILPNGILSGLTASLDVANHVLIQRGVWIIDRVQYAINTISTFTPDAQDATLSRYDVVYADTSNHLQILSGSLSASPIIPQVPDSTLLVCTVLITPTTVTLGQPFPNGYVDLVTNQTIHGIKTFADSPQVPNGVNPQDAVAFGQLANIPQNYRLWTTGSTVSAFNLFSTNAGGAPNLYLAKRAVTAGSNTTSPALTNFLNFGATLSNSVNIASYVAWSTASSNFTPAAGPYLYIQNNIETVPSGSGMKTFPLFSQAVSPLRDQFLRFTLVGDQTNATAHMYVYEFFGFIIPEASRGVWYELSPSSRDGDIITTLAGYQFKFHVDVCRNANSSFFEFRLRVELLVNPGSGSHLENIVCEFNDSNQTSWNPSRAVPSNYWSILNSGTDPNTLLPQWNGTETVAIAEIAGVTLGYGASSPYPLKTRGNTVIFNNTSASNIVNFQVNNSIVSEVDSAGFLRGPGIGDLASLSNASILTTSTGTRITRTVVDSNPVLSVISSNTTGNIVSFSNGSNVGHVTIDGYYRGAGIYSLSGLMNGFISLSPNGTVIGRNTGDGVPALKIQQTSLNSTGDLIEIQNPNKTVWSLGIGSNVIHYPTKTAVGGNAIAYNMMGFVKPSANGDVLTGMKLSPVLGTSTIATWGSLTGGTGYPNGTYLSLLTGGTGIGAVAVITVSGGIVTVLPTIAESGVNYTVGDVLTIVAIDATTGLSAGSGGTVTVASVTSYTLGISNVLEVTGGSSKFAAPTASYPTLVLSQGATYTGTRSGAMWQDGTHLYAYIGGAVRQLDQQASGGSAGVNGLNGTTNIGLGGSLAGNTAILLNSHNLAIQSLANVGLTLNDGASATLYGGNSADYGSINLNATNTFVGMVHPSPAAIMGFNFITATGTIFTDTYFNAGFSYAANYAVANASNPRWVVDKAYVDAHAASAAGSSTQIQFNTSGAFAASADLAYVVSGSNRTLAVGTSSATNVGILSLGGSTAGGQINTNGGPLTITSDSIDYKSTPTGTGHRFYTNSILRMQITDSGSVNLNTVTGVSASGYLLTDSSKNAITGLGAANQIACVNSAGTAPEFRSLSVSGGLGGGYTTGAINLYLQDAVNAVSNVNVTVVSVGAIYKLSTVTANRTINLTSASASPGQRVTFWNTNTSGSFSWSFTGSGTATDSLGAAITTLSNGVIYTLESDGSNWIWLDNTAGTAQYFTTGTFVGAGTLASPFSLGQVVGVGQLTATGAPSSSTFLRGDNTWAAISGAVASVSNVDGTLTIPSTTGTVVASLALGHANTWTGLQTYNQAGNGTTPTDAIVIGTSIVATSGVPQQFSGGLNFLGYEWNTSGTPASHPINFRIQLEPQTGANDLAYLSFKYSKNGGAYSAAFNLSTDGNFIVPNGSFTVNKGFIGATTTDGIVLDGVAAATSGTVIQKSTMFRQQASIWNTTTTAAANYTAFGTEVSGVSGLIPIGRVDWYGGMGTSSTVSLTRLMTLYSSGTLTLKPTLSTFNTSGTFSAAQMISGFATNAGAPGYAQTTPTVVAVVAALGGITQGTRFIWTLDNSVGVGAVTLTLGTGFSWGTPSGATIGAGLGATYMVVFMSATTAMIAQIV